METPQTAKVCINLAKKVKLPGLNILALSMYLLEMGSKLRDHPSHPTASGRSLSESL
jgi:hypothetical protein